LGMECSRLLLSLPPSLLPSSPGAGRPSVRPSEHGEHPPTAQRASGRALHLHGTVCGMHYLLTRMDGWREEGKKEGEEGTEENGLKAIGAMRATNTPYYCFSSRLIPLPRFYFGYTGITSPCLSTTRSGARSRPRPWAPSRYAHHPSLPPSLPPSFLPTLTLSLPPSLLSQETIGKPIESTHLRAADPQSRMIALHLYEVRSCCPSLPPSLPSFVPHFLPCLLAFLRFPGFKLILFAPFLSIFSLSLLFILSQLNPSLPPSLLPSLPPSLRAR